MSNRTAPGIAVQSRQDAQCHHSREPFAAAFYVVNERRDITAAAKLVHAHLVTLHRTKRDATQVEIGEALGMSRHQVWRAIGELVTADLVQTIRYGLGRPNGYVLLGLDQGTLDGKGGRASASRPAGGSVAGPARPHARVPSYPKKRDEERDTRPKAEADASGDTRSASRCWVCPGRHPLDACPEFPRRR